MATLYELQNQFQKVYEMEDLDEEVLNDTLESIDAEIEIKAEGYAKLIKNLSADEIALDEEIKRLQSKKEVVKNKVFRLKTSLQDAMLAVGKSKFKSGLFTFNVQKNAPSVDVVNLKAIPERYFVQQEPKLDKKSLLADLKAGEEIAGADIRRTESLRIR